MKQDRLVVTAGFMPAAVMALLLLLENQRGQGAFPNSLWATVAVEIGLYLIPILVLCLVRDQNGERASLRLKPNKRKTVWFVFWMSLTCSVLSALVNAGFSLFIKQDVYEAMEPAAFGSGAAWQVLLVVVILPAIMEELFFRGVLFSALERSGTWPALLLSSLAFAMVHGNLSNFVGPLVAGLIYGYMTYVLDSVWPAVFAHIVHNLSYLFLSEAARTYSVLGIWRYVALISVFFLCLFLALAMRSLENLIEKGRIRRLQSQDAGTTLTGLFVSPGMWLLLILFIIRVLYF